VRLCEAECFLLHCLLRKQPGRHLGRGAWAIHRRHLAADAAVGQPLGAGDSWRFLCMIPVLVGYISMCAGFEII